MWPFLSVGSRWSYFWQLSSCLNSCKFYTHTKMRRNSERPKLCLVSKPQSNHKLHIRWQLYIDRTAEPNFPQLYKPSVFFKTISQPAVLNIYLLRNCKYIHCVGLFSMCDMLYCRVYYGVWQTTACFAYVQNCRVPVCLPSVRLLLAAVLCGLFIH